MFKIFVIAITSLGISYWALVAFHDGVPDYFQISSDPGQVQILKIP